MEREVWRRRSVVSRGDENEKEVRLPQEFCCGASDETGGLDLGDQRKKRSSGSLPCYVVGIFVIFI